MFLNTFLIDLKQHHHMYRTTLYKKTLNAETDFK